MYKISERSRLSSGARLRGKLAHIGFRHKEVKMAFCQLRLQIETGLNEAEEVFASLAIPLMKLVGLKTVQMATEGRFTSIITDRGSSDKEEFVNLSSVSVRTTNFARAGDRYGRSHGLQEEGCRTKASLARKEFVEKQQVRVVQLVHILKEIETQVNSHQDRMLHLLSDRMTVLEEFLRKAMNHMHELRSQNYDLYPIVLKLFKILFKNVGDVLGSVQNGLENLMQDLTKNMCNPMVEYVNGLKLDMKRGAFARLISVMEDLEKANMEKKLELDETRKLVLAAEEGKMQALGRLKDTEERVNMLDACLRLLPAAEEGPRKSADHAQKCIEGQETSEDRLLWDLLNRNNNRRIQASPIGTRELCMPSNLKQNKRTKLKAPVSVCPRRVTRSHSGLIPQTPGCRVVIPLGKSPSEVAHQSKKRF